MTTKNTSHEAQSAGVAEENKTSIKQQKNLQKGKAVRTSKPIRSKNAVRVKKSPEKAVANKPKKAPKVSFSMFGLNGKGADKVMAYPSQFEVQFLINHYERVVETNSATIESYLASGDQDKLESYALAQERLRYWENVRLKSEEDVSQEIIP